MTKIKEPIIKRLDKKIYVAVEKVMGDYKETKNIYRNSIALKAKLEKVKLRYKWWVFLAVPYLAVLFAMPILMHFGYFKEFFLGITSMPKILFVLIGIASSNPFIFMLEARIKQRRLEHALELLDIKKELETELYLSNLNK